LLKVYIFHLISRAPFYNVFHRVNKEGFLTGRMLQRLETRYTIQILQPIQSAAIR
jgi:hypothetical protein